MSEEKKVKKPPLGIIPEKLWNEKRMVQIEAAMKRFNRAGMVIPKEWIVEYNNLQMRNLKIK